MSCKKISRIGIFTLKVKRLDFLLAKNPVGIDAGSRRNRIVNATEMQLREVFEKFLITKQ